MSASLSAIGSSPRSRAMAGRRRRDHRRVHGLHEESDRDDEGDEVAGHVAGVRGTICRTWGREPHRVKGLSQCASLTNGKPGQRRRRGAAGRQPQARREAAHGEGPQDRLDPLAAAPAQRSLRRGGEAAGLPLARGVQACRDGRQIPLPQAGDGRARSRRGTRRLEPDRGGAGRLGRGEGAGARRRFEPDRAAPRRRGADAGCERGTMRPRRSAPR